MKCPNCGAGLEVDESRAVVECEYCGCRIEIAPETAQAGVTQGDALAGERAFAGEVAEFEVNGVRYDSLDDMPPDLRKLVESTLQSTPNVSRVYDVGGIRYESLDDMPPDIRRLVESAVRAPSPSPPTQPPALPPTQPRSHPRAPMQGSPRSQATGCSTLGALAFIVGALLVLLH